MSAGGAGVSPLASSLESTKVSMGEETQRVSSTAGSRGGSMGRKDQNRRPASQSMPPPWSVEADPDWGKKAPDFTHCTRSAISRSLSRPVGGILRSGSSKETARISRLSSGPPGVTAGPRLPPASMASAESSLNPPIGLEVSAPWQAWQRSTSSGRIRFSKNSAWAESEAPSPAGDPRTTSQAAILSRRSDMPRFPVGRDARESPTLRRLMHSLSKPLQGLKAAFQPAGGLLDSRDGRS